MPSNLRIFRNTIATIASVGPLKQAIQHATFIYLSLPPLVHYLWAIPTTKIMKWRLSTRRLPRSRWAKLFLAVGFFSPGFLPRKFWILTRSWNINAWIKIFATCSDLELNFRLKEKRKRRSVSSLKRSRRRKTRREILSMFPWVPPHLPKDRPPAEAPVSTLQQRWSSHLTHRRRHIKVK